eukprot:369969_1
MIQNKISYAMFNNKIPSNRIEIYTNDISNNNTNKWSSSENATKIIVSNKHKIGSRGKNYAHLKWCIVPYDTVTENNNNNIYKISIYDESLFHLSGWKCDEKDEKQPGFEKKLDINCEKQVIDPKMNIYNVYRERIIKIYERINQTQKLAKILNQMEKHKLEMVWLQGLYVKICQKYNITHEPLIQSTTQSASYWFSNDKNDSKTTNTQWNLNDFTDIFMFPQHSAFGIYVKYKTEQKTETQTLVDENIINSEQKISDNLGNDETNSFFNFKPDLEKWKINMNKTSELSNVNSNQINSTWSFPVPDTGCGNSGFSWSSSVYDCDICGRKFQNYETLINHSIVHKNKNHTNTYAKQYNLPINLINCLWNAFQRKIDVTIQRINKQSFIEIMQQELGMENKSQIEQIFTAFDDNKSGELDFNAIIYGISILHHGTNEDKIRLAFRSVCYDNMNRINNYDLRNIFKLLTAKHENVNDKEITTWVIQCFEKYDTQQKGYLDFTDFKQMIHRRPVLIQAFFSINFTNFEEINEIIKVNDFIQHMIDIMLHPMYGDKYKTIIDKYNNKNKYSFVIMNDIRN